MRGEMRTMASAPPGHRAIAEGVKMLLKHIMTGGTMVVKYESRRPTIPEWSWSSLARPAFGAEPHPGRVGRAVRSAPHVHRLGGTRRTQRLNPEPAADRTNSTRHAVGSARRKHATA